MTINPDDLRKRADAAEVAGDDSMAETLRAEADEMEKSTVSETTGDAPQ